MSDTLATTGVVEVNGKEFAVGLFWQTAENPDSARKEAREAAIQETDPPENYCVRQGHVTQWGLGGWQGSGHRTGMVCAAPILAEELTGNWLGVFKTPQGWWFVSARRDAILPDGDVLYDNEEEPRDRFEMEFGRGGWDRVFTPPEWAIGGDPTELDDLIGATVANEVKLQSVAGMLGPITKSIANPAHRKYWVGALGSVAVALVGYVALQAVGSIFDDQGTIAQPTPIPPTPKPVPKRMARDRTWEQRPTTSDWASSCLSALGKVYFEIPGWTIERFACLEGSATAQYTRAGSTIGTAQTAINNRNVEVKQEVRAGLGAPNPIFSRFGGDGNFVNLTIPYEAVNGGAIRPRDAQVLMSRPELEADIWQRFQEIAMEVNLQFNKAAPQPTQGEPETPCSVPAPAIAGFAAPVGPAEFARIFDQIPGSYFETATLDVGSNQWEYTVRVEEATVNDDAYRDVEGTLKPDEYRPKRSAGGTVNMRTGPSVCSALPL